MPAGISILNNSDTVLIDDTYKNMCVRYKKVDTTVVSGAETPDMIYAVQSPDSGSVTTWGFDVPPAPTSTYGFQVFNAAGQCTFDALLQYARVVDKFTWDGADGTTLVKTYPSGRSYAAVIAQRAMRAYSEVRIDPELGLPYKNYRRWRSLSEVKTNANQVTAKWGPYLNNNPTWSPPVQDPQIPGPLTYNLQSDFIVLDVTGY